MLACHAAIDDEGPVTRRAPGIPASRWPTGPEFPDGVDWTSIDPRLANRILWLRSAATRADQEMRYAEEGLHDPPENEPWFSYRRDQCHKLLRKALYESVRLRQIAGLPSASDDPFDNIWG